ncbi:hypothetical protein ACOSQ2_020495 [Xanthoceras sorbifolium]
MDQEGQRRREATANGSRRAATATRDAKIGYSLRQLSFLSTLISRHLPPLRRAGHLLHIFSLPSPSPYSYFPPLPSLLSSSPADSQLPLDVCFLAPTCLSSPRALLLLATSPVPTRSRCLLSRCAAFLRSSSLENVKKKTVNYCDYLVVLEWEVLERKFHRDPYWISVVLACLRRKLHIIQKIGCGHGTIYEVFSERMSPRTYINRNLVKIAF